MMRILKSVVLIALISFSIQKNFMQDDFDTLYKPIYIQQGDSINFPTRGSSVTVNYTGTFQDGTKFDSSYDRSTPFTFTLQQGQVIKCWDNVVSKMSQGQKIKVTCPSYLAYGSRGAGTTIPPNTDINFEIELLSWK